MTSKRLHVSVASLGGKWGRGGPPWVTPSGVDTPMKKIFVAEFLKNTTESTSEGGRRQVKKGDDEKKVASWSAVFFQEKIWVTPSVCRRG